MAGAADNIEFKLSALAGEGEANKKDWLRRTDMNNKYLAKISSKQR